MKAIYMIIVFVGLVSGMTFSILDRCACGSYTLEDLCLTSGYCSWVNKACVDLQCSTLDSSTCYEEQTEFKCQWKNGKCQSKTYTCSDITQHDQCNIVYGNNCTWKNSTNSCVDFTCTGIEEMFCNPLLCSFVNGTCGDPKTIDCSTVTNCTGTHSGTGQACIVNDNGECKQYNILPMDCTDYGDLKQYCQEMCNYDASQKSCKTKTCSDFTQKDNCTYIRDLYKLTATTCYWDGSKCQEAAATNIESFTIQPCINSTYNHYAWDFSGSKCVSCQSLSADPYFQTVSKSLSKLKDLGSSYEMILMSLLTVLFFY